MSTAWIVDREYADLENVFAFRLSGQYVNIFQKQENKDVFCDIKTKEWDNSRNTDILLKAGFNYYCLRILGFIL